MGLEIGESHIVVAGRIGVDGRRADDAVAPQAADRIEEGRERLLQGELDRRVVDGGDGVDLIEEEIDTQLQLLDPVVAEFHRLGVDRAAVMEFGARLELDGVGQPVGGDAAVLHRRHLSGQVRLERRLIGAGELEESLVDVGEDRRSPAVIPVLRRI